MSRYIEVCDLRYHLIEDMSNLYKEGIDYTNTNQRHDNTKRSNKNIESYS